VYRSVQVMARYGRQFPWTDLITRQYPLDEAQAALEDVAAQRVVKALIVPSHEDAEVPGAVTMSR
jgi:hypothetical protein